MTSALLVLLLSQAGGADTTPAEAVTPPLPASPTGGWRYLTRLEATGLALLPVGGVGGVESYAQLTPMLVVAEGEAFGLNLGAPVRLRLAGGEVGAGLVRREDWDGVRLGGLLQRHLSLSLGAEVFGWGRVDVDGRLAAQLANRNLEVFPKGDGALCPGAFASLGLGVDNAR